MSEDWTGVAAEIGIAAGFEQAAFAVARRTRGPAGLAAQGALAVGELGATGQMRGASAAGIAASAAGMVGARLIPGVGWAMLAYTGADLASQAFLGKPFGETWVGRPIDWAIDKTERAGIGLATRAFDAVGWTEASRFMDETLGPWALGQDKPVSGFVRGPETAMTADDWYEHPPRDYGTRSPTETAPTHIEPEASEISARRTDLLARENTAIEQAMAADEIGIASGRDADAIRRLATALGESVGDQQTTTAPQRRESGHER